MNYFDKNTYIAKQQSIVEKFLTVIAKQGVKFLPTDGELENVVFIRNGVTFKMSHHSFYRFSGIKCVYREKANNEIETVDITDEMYLNEYIKRSIDVNLGIK